MNIRPSDLPLLIALDALLAELNVTRAARRLHISQPAMSGQLARLRELFEDPLLVPAETGRGMVPTQRALELKPRLSDALRQLQGAVASSDAFNPQTARRTFVIAANDNVFSILGIPALRKLLESGNPELCVSFVSPLDQGVVQRLEQGDIDLYMGDEGKMPSALKSRFLMRDGFEMAQRKHHPRGLQPASLQEYCALSHVLVSQLGQFNSHIDELLAIVAQERHVALSVPSYNQVALVLAHTNCVATLPKRLLQHYSSIIDVLPPPLEIPEFRISMAWHPRSQADAGHRWLRALFVSVAETLAP